MRHARLLVPVAIAAACTSAFGQLGQSASGLGRRSTIEIRIHLTAEKSNDRLPQQIHVELLTAQGIAIADAFSDGRELGFNAPPASYAVRVSGFGIESSVSPSFEVDPSEFTHFETVTVKVKSEAPGESSAGGVVSAADLRAPEKAQREYERAMQEFAKKKLPEAEKHFIRAVEAYPQFFSAWARLGDVHSLQNQWDEAIVAYKRAVETDTTQIAAEFSLSHAQFKANKIGDADATLSHVVKEHPTEARAWAVLAEMQLQEGKTADAIASAIKVHALPHQHLAGVHLVAMQALAREHRNEEAVEQARLYLAEDPKGPMADTIRERLRLYEASQARH